MPKYEKAKYSFEFSYTISNKWTHILSMLVHLYLYRQNQLLKGRVCFKSCYYLRKEYATLREHILSFKITPMILDNNFKGYSIDKPPKLNYSNMSVY